jgi:hypothetical protein
MHLVVTEYQGASLGCQSLQLLPGVTTLMCEFSVDTESRPPIHGLLSRNFVICVLKFVWFGLIFCCCCYCLFFCLGCVCLVGRVETGFHYIPQARLEFTL